MSIEYFAPGKVDDAGVDELARRLEADDRFRTVSSGDRRRILLQLAQNPPRSEWPEDVETQIRDGSVCVAFHSATRDERGATVEFLESVLAAIGCPARFHEE